MTAILWSSRDGAEFRAELIRAGVLEPVEVRLRRLPILRLDDRGRRAAGPLDHRDLQRRLAQQAETCEKWWLRRGRPAHYLREGFEWVTT